MDLKAFAEIRKRIDYTVSTREQWVGICNEDGWPIMDITAIANVSASETRGETASCEVAVEVPEGSRLIDELVGSDTGINKTGELEIAGAAARLLVVQRAGMRMAYTITHTVATGKTAPTQLTIHGVDLIESLAAWPCPTIPLQWQNASFTQWTTDASGQEYTTTRELARVEMGTAADGYTVDGPAAATVRTLIQDSLDAVNTAMGWADSPHMVVDFPMGEDTSPRLVIRTNDDTIWETIAAPAHSAGLTISVDLWWPGDTPLRRRASRDPATYAEWSPTVPIQLVTVEVSQ
ncbi:hypothetical protein HMPREF2943_03100 [Corynebacterium sp. HMSC072D12]|uniref:hypothetical protein n=1 Tax=Corynebacterium sp. HMSC072D12 TaxID=1739447 RepID=UPI0008A4C267|nr:hypothetical protein [Corynebacterium sp. HMSC072D12]OFQ34014.1 hypothetical protein HMPREF2943_03100 [Corynebacterium sp. HMSC072D12]